jgi:hypothetical protein
MALFMPAKLFVPARAAPGLQVMFVHRNDRARVIAFPDVRQAQLAIDACAYDDVRPTMVWETSLEEIASRMHSFGLDLCEFESPGQVCVTTSVTVPWCPEGSMTEARRYLERIADMS